MAKIETLVADLLAAAGGEITGRVRMQKMFYLLQQLGLTSDLHFRFHHYGPYSKNLDEAIDGAKALYGVQEVISYRLTDGAPFSVFKGPTRVLDKVGEMQIDRARELSKRLLAQSSTVLELAATIHWIEHVDKIVDWRPELKRRKGQKTEGGRAEKALELLKDLGLEAAV